MVLLCCQLTDSPVEVTVGVLGAYVDSCAWNIAQSDSVSDQEARDSFNPSVPIRSIFSQDIARLIYRVTDAGMYGCLTCSVRFVLFSK